MPVGAGIIRTAILLGKNSRQPSTCPYISFLLLFYHTLRLRTIYLVKYIMPYIYKSFTGLLFVTFSLSSLGSRSLVLIVFYSLDYPSFFHHVAVQTVSIAEEH